jgi:hypothetical protein
MWEEEAGTHLTGREEQVDVDVSGELFFCAERVLERDEAVVIAGRGGGRGRGSEEGGERIRGHDVVR